MVAFSNKIFTWLFSVVMLVAAAFFAYSQNYYILLIPFAVFVAIYLVQFPSHLYYLLLIAIPWSIEYNFTPALGTDLPDEPLMLVAAFAGMLGMVYYRKRIGAAIFFHPLVFVLLVSFLWMIFTVAGSTEKILSLKYMLAKTWYLLAFVVVPLFLFRDEKILKRAACLLLLSMSAFMFYAMYQHKQFNWTFEKINDALDPFYRNHVNYSALLVFMVPIQIAVMRLTRDKVLRVIIFGLLITTFIALYFSYARGAWLALIAGLITYYLLRKKILVWGYVFFIVASITAVFWLRSGDRYLKFSPDYESTIFHTNFREHLIATYQMKDVSTAERFNRWVAGVRMIEDSWTMGLGPASFYQRYKSYTQPAFRTWVSRNEEQSTVHNYFLLMIIEQGIIGFLLFVLLVGMMFRYSQKIFHRATSKFWKAAVAAVAVILVMQCVVNSLSDLIETDKVGSIFYLCFSVLVVADLNSRTSIRQTDMQRM